MRRCPFHLTVLFGVATASGLVIHDDTWQPHYVLRVTAQNYHQAYTERYSTLVNGSSPGPELRLKEDQVSWIRVYNDMTEENTTMAPHPLDAHPFHAHGRHYYDIGGGNG